jgi:hypothetical protein
MGGGGGFNFVLRAAFQGIEWLVWLAYCVIYGETCSHEIPFLKLPSPNAALRRLAWTGSGVSDAWRVLYPWSTPISSLPREHEIVTLSIFTRNKREILKNEF